MQIVIHLLGYLAAHSDATIILLNVHSEVSYLFETKARCSMAGCYFFRSVPMKGEDVVVKENIFLNRGILKIMVCSSTKAELGALFLNLREGKYCGSF